jgi:hypothetical protein
MMDLDTNRPTTAATTINGGAARVAASVHGGGLSGLDLVAGMIERRNFFSVVVVFVSCY